MKSLLVSLTASHRRISLLILRWWVRYTGLLLATFTSSCMIWDLVARSTGAFCSDWTCLGLWATLLGSSVRGKALLLVVREIWIEVSLDESFAPSTCMSCEMPYRLS